MSKIPHSYVQVLTFLNTLPPKRPVDVKRGTCKYVDGPLVLATVLSSGAINRIQGHDVLLLKLRDPERPSALFNIRQNHITSFNRVSKRRLAFPIQLNFGRNLLITLFLRKLFFEM